MYVSDKRDIDTGGGAAVGGDANTGGGGFTGRDHIEPKASSIVNVYATPEKPQRRRKTARKSSPVAATIDERVIYRLNEHDVKLAKLEMFREADLQTMLEYKRDLRQDVEEIKKEIKPLFGMNILAQQPGADKDEKERVKEQNRLVVRLLTVIAISFGIGVVLFIGFIVWLALSRV